MKMREDRDILERLRIEGEALEIPEKISPEQMEKSLAVSGSESKGKRKDRRRFKMIWFAPAAACLALAAGLLAGNPYSEFFGAGRLAGPEPGITDSAGTGFADIVLPEERELIELQSASYEEIYAKLDEVWQQERLYADSRKYLSGSAVKEESADWTTGAAPVTELMNSVMSDTAGEAFGKTNIQVEQVDEADRVKNDGRYLYQAVRRGSGEELAEGSGTENNGIQILDTKGGLKEAAFVGGFENLEEFYVWEDLLITIENKYDFGDVLEDSTGYKRAYGLSWHEITFYDIADREHPHKKKTFTFQGSYETSRVVDGYFYGISSFMAQPGEGEEDYSAYIPAVDGKQMSEDRIYCPEELGGTNYLVLVSIDLEKPDSVKDSRALLWGSGIYYMSRKNIYAAEYESVYKNEPKREGTFTDRTKLLKFSCIKGNFYAQAQGEIPGRLNDSFSLDEYGGCLRAVTTVQTYRARIIQDDRTKETIGCDFGEPTRTNALYILGSRLLPRGKIEGLAEGEEIYSARFLGDTGYFVTFRQVDPLFAVDLSNPEAPKVLGELKVSGFSEYLHFYGENLLLGIGMEADEETGRTEGMKLSMFDLSDPARLQEISKKNLKEYNYSEALWNHHAVLIDTEENLIGFPAEGSDRGGYWKDYLVFAYEDGAFVQKFKFRDDAKDGGYYQMRGTFIGDRFYLLKENGNVWAYDRKSGEMVEEIK